MKIHVFAWAALASLAPASALAADEGSDRRSGTISQTSEGFHYFNKPGARMDDHDGDLLDCIQAGRFLDQPDATTATSTAGAAGGFLGALAGGVADGLASARLERRGIAANTENCMVVKGWRVVGVDPKRGEELDDFADPEIRPVIAEWVGLDAPPGPILREPFANDLLAANADFELAKKAGESSLSVRSYRDILRTEINSYYGLDGAVPSTTPRPDRPLKEPDRFRSDRPTVVTAKDLAAADPEASYLVFRVTGARARGARTGPYFIRLDPDKNHRALDGDAWVMAANFKRTRFESDSESGEFTMDFVAKVPPGTWALAGLRKDAGGEDLIVSTCLGAPVFTITAGATVYAGSMILPRDGGFPLNVADMEVAKSILAANPALAEKAESAAYENGHRLVCSGAYMYAYEVPGAPFVEGYEWGSAAKTRLSEADDAP